MDTRVEVGLSSNSEVRTQELRLLSTHTLIGQHWPMVQEALKETRELFTDAWTEDMLLAAAMEGKVQLWQLLQNDAPTAYILSQFYMTNTTPIFQIFWAYGFDLKKMIPLLSDAFDRFAAQHGAVKIEIQGRKGFEKWLEPFNFGVDYVVYSRRVSPPKEQ